MAKHPRPGDLLTTFNRYSDLPPTRHAASILMRAAELGIRPRAVADWLVGLKFASPELRNLAADWSAFNRLAIDVGRNRRESRDPRKTAEKAVAHLLSPVSATLTGEQHRRALTVISAVAQRTAGPVVEGWGDAVYIGGADLGVILGITGAGARKRIDFARTMGALDGRLVTRSGRTTKLRLARAPFEQWEVTRQPAPAELVAAIVRGERTVLEAITHPAAGYGSPLSQDAAIMVMITEAGLDPLEHGFSTRGATRVRAALRAAGVTDTTSLLEALDFFADLPAEGGEATPNELHQAAIAKRRAEADRRTAENEELRTARTAARQLVDHGAAHLVAGKVTPLVRRTLDALGRPGGLTGPELKDWATGMRAFLSPELTTEAERAAAMALVARACEEVGQTQERAGQLAFVAIEGMAVA